MEVGGALTRWTFWVGFVYPDPTPVIPKRDTEASSVHWHPSSMELPCAERGISSPDQDCSRLESKVAALMFFISWGTS